MWQGCPGAPVLDCLGHHRANFAKERRVGGKRLIDSLEHGHAFPAGEQTRELVGWERSEHRDVQHANADPARRPQTVAHRLSEGHDTALCHEEVVRGVDPMPADSRVGTTGQFGELGERPIGQVGHMVEVEGPLRGDALRVVARIL